MLHSFTTPLTLPGMKIGIVSNKNNDLCIDYMKIVNSNNFVNIAEWNTPEDTKTEDQA